MTMRIGFLALALSISWLVAPPGRAAGSDSSILGMGDADALADPGASARGAETSGRVTAAAPPPTDPLQRLPDHDDELTLYTLPAVGELDWESPASLLATALKNVFKPAAGGYKRRIGHMFVHLKTRTYGRDEWVGMTTADDGEAVRLVEDKRYGLGVLTADQLGKLDDPARLKQELAFRETTGEFAFLRILLSKPLAKRLVDYLDGIKQRGADLHYGGANRPRHGEGGGCAPFAVSFLAVAGLIEREYLVDAPGQKAWKFEVGIPPEYFGGPLSGRRVDKFEVAFGRHGWLKPEDPRAIRHIVWEPTRITKWIHAQYDREMRSPSRKWRFELRDRAKGLGLDARNRQPPRGPIFLGTPSGGPDHPFGRQSGEYHQHPTGPEARPQ